MPWRDRRNAVERLYGTPVVLGGRGAKAALRRFALILVTVIAALVGVTLFFGLLFD